jgi:ribosomal protein S18 acetylase RimI-like enzyme
MVFIQSLDHRDLLVAQRIHALLARANAQEVDLVQAGDSSSPKRTPEDIQSSSEFFLGAFLEGELVGSMGVGPGEEPGHIGIESLAVHADHQRQGVGRSLVVEALRRGHGVPFSVVSAAANLPALALYRHLGFIECRRGTLGPERLLMVQLRRARSDPGAL